MDKSYAFHSAMMFLAILSHIIANNYLREATVARGLQTLMDEVIALQSGAYSHLGLLVLLLRSGEIESISRSCGPTVCSLCGRSI